VKIERNIIPKNINQQIRKNHDTNKQIRKITNSSLSVKGLSEITKLYAMFFGHFEGHKFEKVSKDIMKHLQVLEQESKNFDSMVSNLEKKMKKMH